MRFHFDTEQWLPYPPELVFAFFANPENLPRLMPPWQRTRIEQATFVPPPSRPTGAPRYPGVVAGSGTHITLTMRPFPYSPLRLPWDALIEDFRWNEGFCDVQERGPFHYWRHCHTVESAGSPQTGAIGTLLRDHIDYEFPLVTLSAIVNRLIVHPQLAATFRYRQKRAAELLALMTSPSG